MTRVAAWIALATVAAGVVGCGPGKELPADIPKSDDAGPKPVVVPKQSDPAAKEYIDKAVKAFAGDKPELVARGKVSRLALKGKMLTVVENQSQPLETTRTVAAVWPDRFHGMNDQTVQGKRVTVEAWLHRPNLTIRSGGQDYDPPNPVELERNLAADTVAQHWMALFQPLTDPKVVVFDLHPHVAEQKQVQMVKLALGDYPVFQLTFDAEPGKPPVLLRVAYTVREMGVDRKKQWTMIEHNPGPDGLLLPGRMECRHDNKVVEEWAAEKWEFPAKIEDAEFSPPRK